MSPRPGLAKVRRIPFLGTRSVHLVRTSPHAAALLAASADVVSEGGERDEAGVRRYYGTSSFAFSLDEEDCALAALVADPHLRVHVLRRAREEAASRATGTVGTLRAEILVRRRRNAQGMQLEILVELEIDVARARRVGG